MEGINAAAAAAPAAAIAAVAAENRAVNVSRLYFGPGAMPFGLGTIQTAILVQQGVKDQGFFLLACTRS